MEENKRDFLDYPPEFNTPLMRHLRQYHLEDLRRIMLDLAQYNYKPETVTWRCGVGEVTLTFYGAQSILDHDLPAGGEV